MEHSAPPDRLGFLAGATRAAEGALGRIDHIRFQDAVMHDVDPEGQRRIPAGCSVYLRGWVFAPPHQPASDVFLLIGADVAAPVLYGEARWDIASAYDDPKLEHVGFRGVYPLAGLPLGSYDIRIAAFVPNTNDYHLFETSERFEIVESHHLFPGTRLAPKDSIEFYLDSITTKAGRQPRRGSLNVRRGETVAIRGWAIDHEQSSAATGIFALIDGKEYIGGIHGLPRHDVALARDMFGARRCGFTIRVPVRGLAPGSHKLQIVAVAADGVSYAVADGVKLTVTAG